MSPFAMALNVARSVLNVDVISESTMFSCIMEEECYFKSRLEMDSTREERGL